MASPNARKWLVRGSIALVALVVVALAGLFLAARYAAMSRPFVDLSLVPPLGAPPPPLPALPTVTVEWTGVAGVRVTARAPATDTSPAIDATLLIDPYVTRHTIAELAFPLDVDTATLFRIFPRADAILAGHSHHDHLLDAIPLATALHAPLFGSRSSCVAATGMMTARSLPPPECRALQDGDTFRLGPFEVTTFAHPHGTGPTGVPFPGEIEAMETAQPSVFALKMGGAHAFVVRALGRTVYHQGSAGLDDALLGHVTGLAPDLALIGIALRQGTPDFTKRLLGALQPRHVAAIHHDDFFGGRLGRSVPLLPGVDLKGFEAEVDAALGTGALVRLAPFDPVEVASGGADPGRIP